MYGRLGAANYTDFFTSSASEYQIDGLELAGSTLMNAGFQLPGARHDGDSWIFHFVKL